MTPSTGQVHGRRGDLGQGMVEYALILAFIAIVVVVALGLLGGQVAAFFQQVVTIFQGL